jgi:hypothetical protein
MNGPYVELELGVFGSFVCTKEVALGSIKVELFIFKKIVVPTYPFNCLGWWSNHKQQFSNLSYFVHQIMGIIGSQIKSERIFNMANVITSLKGC